MKVTKPTDDETEREREREWGRERCLEGGSHSGDGWRCHHRNKGGSTDLIRDKQPGDKQWLRERL